MNTPIIPKNNVNIIAGDRSSYLTKLINPVMKAATPVMSIDMPIILACMLPGGVIPFLTPKKTVIRHKRKRISNPLAYLPSNDLGIFYLLLLKILSKNICPTNNKNNEQEKNIRMFHVFMRPNARTVPPVF
jgi:hypothetical protein